MTLGKMARIGCCLIPLTVLLLTAVRAAPDTDRRIALVIGTSNYENVGVLPNPVNDAKAISQALRHLKFDVSELYDGNLTALTNAVREFGNRAANAQAAVIYYAGHGIQVAGENYLVPREAKLQDPADLRYESLPLEQLLSEVSRAGRIGIVFLDSCRDNPFSQQTATATTMADRSVATPLQGLARIDNVPTNTMVLMAAKANHRADDGQGHSPFAYALLAHFDIPGLELSTFLRSVHDTVLRATSNRQEPFSFSSLGADPFYFFPRPPNRPPEIGQIKPLQVTEGSDPVPLGIPEPTDADHDALTIRIVGVPQFGEVRIDGQRLAVDNDFPSDRLKKAVYQPDGKHRGPVGSLDILVEDGHGGRVTGSLPITVLPGSTEMATVNRPTTETSVSKVSASQALVANNPPVPSWMNIPVMQRPVWDFARQQTNAASRFPSAQLLEFDAWVDRSDHTYRLGQPVTVSVRPHADSYITVLNYGTSGHMTVVFPNQFQPDNQVRAGQTVEIPPAEAAFRLTASGPAGVELLQIIASDQPLALPEIARIGLQGAALPFVSFDRPAEEVVHDLILQLDPQFGTTSDRAVPVSKIMTVQVLPTEAGLAGQSPAIRPVPGGLPGISPMTPPIGTDTALSVSTDKNVYRASETVQIMVVAHQPCALTLFGTRSSGVISQLFPNSMQPAITLMPGQGLLVPPPTATLRLIAGPFAGIETVVGMCTNPNGSINPAFQQILSNGRAQDIPRDLALVAAQPGMIAGQAATAYFVTQ